MFCPNCGFKLESSNKFCPACGNSIPTTETENKTKNKETPEQIKPKRKTHKHMLAVVLTIVFVVGLVGGGLLLFGDKLFFESEENIITTGYWVKDPNYGWFDDGDDALLFAPINDNETFDGIMMMTTEYIFPYIIGEDGTITVFDYEISVNLLTDSYDWIYSPKFEITIEKSENGSKYLIVKQVKGGGDVKRYNKEDSSNDMLISLLFSEWSDYCWKPESVHEYYSGFRFAVGDLQRSVKFFDFHHLIDYEDEDGGCNADVSLCRYDKKWGWDVSWYETFYYSIDIDEKCIYIDDARYDFNDDFTQLYNVEEELTLYRVTDFHLGKIADADFPPGEFREKFLKDIIN